MQSQKISLSDNTWTEILASGGSAFFQGATGGVLLCFTESSGTPDLSADALYYEPSQTKDGFGFSDIHSGTRLLMRSYSGAASIKVVK